MVPVLLNAYAKQQGLAFVHKVLSKPITRFLSGKSAPIQNIEREEDSVGLETHSSSNAAAIAMLTEDFFNSILSQRDQLPQSIEIICQYISQSAIDVFKDDKIPSQARNHRPHWKRSFVGFLSGGNIKRRSLSANISSNAILNTSSGSVISDSVPDHSETSFKIVATFLFLRFIIPGGIVSA